MVDDIVMKGWRCYLVLDFLEKNDLIVVIVVWEGDKIEVKIWYWMWEFEVED